MPALTLTLNTPRTERVSEAWNAFHTSAGMSFSERIGQPGTVDTYQECALPNDFLKDPLTGIITLRPTFFLLDRFNSDYYAKTWQILEDLFTGGTEQFGAAVHSLLQVGASTSPGATVGRSAGAFSSQFKSITDRRLGLTVDGRLTDWAVDDRANYVWNVATKSPLAPNQGFSLVIAPSGIYTDQSRTYFAAAFGGRFILDITGGGVAYFWGHNGKAWVRLQDFSLADGGVDFTQPFQVSVLMSSRRFITVYFTQAATGAKSSVNRSPVFNDQAQGFLVVLRGGQLEPYWDASLGQWIKTDAAPLTIALAQQYYRYDFQIAKAVYKTGPHPLSLGPESMYKAPTWSPPVIDPRGYSDGQREPSGGAAAAIQPFLRDLQGNPYSAAPHPFRNVVVPEYTFSASGTGTYSPELHGVSVSYPAQIQTSAFVPYDASKQWQLLRFQRTVTNEPSRVEIKFKDEARWQEILKSDGPFRLACVDNSGVSRTLVDGYMRRKQPTIEGPSHLITDQAEGFCMWHRLDGTNFVCDALEGASVAETIRKAIIDAGFAPNEVWVDYDDSPGLHDLTFSKLRNPKDVLRPNEDTSVGDFIRDCAKAWGVQARPPLRVRWVTAPDGMAPPTGNLWRIYLGPAYDPVKGPDCVFTYDSSLIPLLGDYATETQRWQDRVYIAREGQEFATLPPPFNELVARAAADTTGQDKNVERRIAVNDRAVSDPTYVGYEGAVNAKRLGPSELPSVTSADSLEQQIRNYFQIHYNLRAGRLLDVRGEYQPETDCDQFAAVIGRAPGDDPDGRFMKGDPISWGVYRIDFIDISIELDDADPLPTGNPTRRYSWDGTYKFVFADKWERTGDSPIPMFAPDTLLPLGL